MGNGHHQVGEQGDKRKEDRAGQSQTSEDLVDVFRGGTAGTEPGNEPAVFLQIIGHIHRTEGDGGVEIGEENDQGYIQDHVYGMICAEPAGNRGAHTVIGEERADQAGKHQQRHRKDDGDNAGLVDLHGNEGALTAVDLAAHHSFGILYGKSSLTFLDIDNTDDDHESDHNEEQYGKEVGFTASQRLENVHAAVGNTGDDPCEDDEGDPVADAFFGNHFAHPHEHGSTCRERNGQNHYGEEVEIVHGTLQIEGHRDGLHESEDHTTVAGERSHFLSAFRSLFREIFEIRDDDGQQVHNNRSVDVRHDPHGEQTDIFKGTARNNINKAKDVLRE